jgi:Mce-associated membrane protein
MPPGSRRSPTTIALAILVAILLALTLAEGVLLLRSDADEEARSEVLQTSQRFLVLLTTYNADTLEAGRAEILRVATGQFRREYTQVTGPEFLGKLRESRADSKGRVLHLGVTSVKGDDAEAFAVVEVTTTNKDRPQSSVEQSLIELTLTRTASGWRIASVAIVGRVAA